MNIELTASQKEALNHISAYAKARRSEALATIDHVLHMCNISHFTFNIALEKLKQHARVALHFHPDRPDQHLKTVAENLLHCGFYKSQFETLLSNGSVSAHPGGARDLWEKHLFAGAYNLVGSTNAQRPKYGALNLMLHADGPSPRFGSCYFLLKPAVSRRCTFTFLDSHQDPKEKGTYEEFDDILAALLAEVFNYDFALGEGNLTVPKLVQHLATNLESQDTLASDRDPARNSNHYIEAQVHGDVLLERDIDILVADPSFKATKIGETLENLCKYYHIALKWHAGFALPLEDVPSDFRGPTMPSLARRLTQGHYIDTSIIGAAAMDLKRNSEAWLDRGSAAETLQELKLLWHVLVKFGLPWKQFNTDKTT